MSPLLTVCIPSYNRPEQLQHLLSTIDCKPAEIEIVIREDASPKRAEIRDVVGEFKDVSSYNVLYIENKSNLGYDGNFRALIQSASGVFILFLGDDDWFIKGQLDLYLGFLKNNMDVGYVLRSRLALHPDGTLEPFRYFPSSRRIPPGINSCIWLYKRSVSLGGVTFKRESALKYSTDKVDGSLLYQCYLVLEICLREESVYCFDPVVTGAQSYREDKPNFGAAESERGLYEPGKVTPRNSINFTKKYFEVSEFFDTRNGVAITESIRLDLSKYSYPFLSIQRKRGASEFLKYSRSLARETKLNITWFYYLYVVALLFFGERLCDQLIVKIKRVMGRTPDF